MAHIFISYAHNDNDFAKLLIGKLKDAGFTGWRDAEQLRAGKDWGIAIDDAICDSFAVLVVMSENAKNSEYVTYEWAYALGASIIVIPLILERKMLDEGELHTRLARLQYIPFDNHFNLDPSWQRLIEELRRIENEYKIVPKPKVADDAPDYVKNAINLLYDPQYFNTSDYGLIGNLQNAVKNLAASKHHLARKALLQTLEHPNAHARRTAVEALGIQRDVSVVSELKTLLHDMDVEVRVKVVEALAQIGSKECTSEIIGALDDPDYLVRGAAAYSLANFPTEISALLRALKDRHPYVRLHAATALGQIGDARTVSGLVKRLYDTDQEVQNSAYDALKEIGTPEALAAIEKWGNTSQNLQ